MWSSQPKISIVIPIRRESDHLQNTINSVLAQTYRNLEIIVINSGSGWTTEYIARSYGDLIRYYCQPCDGRASALNFAIGLATGEYIGWLFPGDTYAPDKLARQLDVMLQHGGQAVIYSGYDLLSPGRESVRMCGPFPDPDPSHLRCRLAFEQDAGIRSSTLLIPRHMFRLQGMFDPEFHHTFDIRYLFQIAKVLPFVPVKDSLAQLRLTPNQEMTDELRRTRIRMIDELEWEEVIAYGNGSTGRLVELYDKLQTGDTNTVAIGLLRKIRCQHSDFAAWPQSAAWFARLGVTDETEEVIRLSVQPHRKPRIVVYIQVWTIGGTERVLSVLFEQLKDRYDWYLVTTELAMKNQLPLPGFIRHIKLRTDYGEPIGYRLAALCTLLRADLFFGVPTYVIDTLPVFHKLHELGIKSVACNFGNYFLPYSHQFLHPVIGTRMDAFHRASAVTWLTSFSSQVYALTDPNSVVLPPPASFAPSPVPAPKNQKTVLAVGRFNDPNKRLDRVLEVFAKVLQKHSDARLIVVGPYDLKARPNRMSVETTADVLKRVSIPKSRIQWAGEQTDVKPFYRMSSLLMLTSESEGFALVLNEAGSFGLPCVIQNINGLEDVIVDGENGYIVPQGDSDAMANRISLLLSDPDLLARMGNRAYALVDRFSPERIGDRWNRFIETMLTTGMQQRRDMTAVNWKHLGNRVMTEYEQGISKILQTKKLGFLASSSEDPVHDEILPVLKTAWETSGLADQRIAAAQLLDEHIFHSGDREAAVQLVQIASRSLSTSQRSRPVLMFHLYGWQHGGAERGTAGVANELVRRGYRVMIVVFEPIRQLGYVLDPEIAFIPIYGRADRINRLLKLIELIRPDLFIGHNNCMPELAALYPRLKRRGIRSIAYTVEYYFFPHNHSQLFETAVTRSAALTEANAACFLTRFSANVHALRHGNAAVMPRSSSFPLHPVDYSEQGTRKTVLAVGRFSDPIKRLDRVLTMFDHLLLRHPDATLVVAGPYCSDAVIPAGSGITIGEMLNRLSLTTSRIRLVGEQKQVAPYYEQADVFILTSNSEGFANVLAEAGSYGLPAVIVDIPGLEDIIQDGENGFIVPQDDMKLMADRITDLFDDPELYRRMSRQAQELISRYSPGLVGQRWDDLIQCVLTAPSQTELNRQLTERFMPDVDDPAALVRRVALEMERTACRVADM